MKNIIIVGPSRSGKSTLAGIIQKKYKHNIINLDDLVSSLEFAFPEKGINQQDDEREVAKKFMPFLNRFLKRINRNIEVGRTQRYIVEGTYIDLDELFKSYGLKDFIIIGLHYEGQTTGQMLSDIRGYDKESDWTSRMADNELIKKIKNNLKQNDYFIRKYEEYNINNYNTKINREKVFNKIVKDLKKN